MVHYKATIYNGGRIVSRMWSIEWCHFQWPWRPLAPILRSRHYLMLNISETVRDRDTVLMEY